MIPFDYQRADDPAGAVATVTARPDAVFLGGGINLVDHMKLGVASPSCWSMSAGSRWTQ